MQNPEKGSVNHSFRLVFATGQIMQVRKLNTYFRGEVNIKHKYLYHIREDCWPIKFYELNLYLVFMFRKCKSNYQSSYCQVPYTILGAGIYSHRKYISLAIILGIWVKIILRGGKYRVGIRWNKSSHELMVTATEWYIWEFTTNFLSLCSLCFRLSILKMKTSFPNTWSLKET